MNFQTWLEEKFKHQCFESLQVLDHLLDAVDSLSLIEIKAEPDDFIHVCFGTNKIRINVPMAWSKVRMLLSKMGGYYLRQTPDSEMKALFGFIGNYNHKIGEKVLTYFITALNDEGQVPTLRIETEGC